MEGIRPTTLILDENNPVYAQIIRDYPYMQIHKDSDFLEVILRSYKSYCELLNRPVNKSKAQFRENFGAEKYDKASCFRLDNILYSLSDYLQTTIVVLKKGTIKYYNPQKCLKNFPFDIAIMEFTVLAPNEYIILYHSAIMINNDNDIDGSAEEDKETKSNEADDYKKIIAKIEGMSLYNGQTPNWDNTDISDKLLGNIKSAYSIYLITDFLNGGGVMWELLKRLGIKLAPINNNCCKCMLNKFLIRLDECQSVNWICTSCFVKHLKEFKYYCPICSSKHRLNTDIIDLISLFSDSPLISIHAPVSAPVQIAKPISPITGVNPNPRANVNPNPIPPTPNSVNRARSKRQDPAFPKLPKGN